MDLGATLCSPRRPACGLCPVVSGCEAHAQGLAEVLPYRDAKAERPTRRGVAFVALSEDGAVLLRERPLKGLLGGMLETPSSPWTERGESANAALDHAPLKAPWREVTGLVAHTFTHFHLELSIYFAEVPAKTKLNAAAHPERCRWVHVRDLHEAALPSLMCKVLAHALEEKRLRPQARVAGAQPRARRRSA
jgi:A/G-specific adenine glycosylase